MKMERRVWSLHLLMTKMLMMLMTITTMMQPTASSVPIIQAPWGALQGISLTGDGGRKMNAYLGIPYAVPPLGDLRFEKPQPHPGPEEGEVFVADRVMPACPQKKLVIGTRETSEDCLMLDVYVPTGDEPDSDNSKPYAVMVWIHGGGFSLGDAYTFRPSKLVADGKVIVVVIQYRLGVLGFLSSGDDTVTENLGLWDQILALRWIKDNMQAFGGDPGRITVFGESAGGMSVGCLMLIPRSQGLFQRAIMQSGSPLEVLHFTDIFGRKNVFKGLTDIVGCQGDSSRELLQCLKQTPLDHLMNRTAAYESMSPMQMFFFPVIDGELIPGNSRELLQDRTFMDSGPGQVDVMVGFNKHEGALILLVRLMAQVPFEAMYTADFFEQYLQICLAYNGRSNHSVLKQTTEFFYRGAEAGNKRLQLLDPLVDMYGDCLLNVPIMDWIRHLSAAHLSTRPRYMYVVDHEFTCNSQSPIQGAHHGDEVMLLFDMEREFPQDSVVVLMGKMLSREEQDVSRKIVDVWTAFAKTGNPGGPLKEDLHGGQWEPFTVDQEHYMSLSGSPHLVSNLGPYRDRLALWTRLLPELDALVSQTSVPEENSGKGYQPPAREDL